MQGTDGDGRKRARAKAERKPKLKCKAPQAWEVVDSTATMLDAERVGSRREMRGNMWISIDASVGPAVSVHEFSTRDGWSLVTLTHDDKI